MDECGYDGGDCGKCKVADITLVGNGVCDGGEYNVESCGYDGGDCDECKVPDIALVGNGICNGVEYNVDECGYDGGDCDETSTEDQVSYSTTLSTNSVSNTGGI